MYGGTKTEMERLIQDAAKLDKTIKANDLSFANIVKAIHAVQVELGISGIAYEEYTQLVESGAMTQEEAFALLGTTAKEARYTISGSLNSMKSAWSNLITGLANENADFDSLIDNMIDTAGAFADNVLPRIETAIGGISKVLNEYVSQVLPNLVDALTQALTGEEELPIITLAKDVVKTFAKAITDNKEGLAQGGLSLMKQLAGAVVDASFELVGAAGSLILTFATELTKPEQLQDLWSSGATMVEKICDGIGDAFEAIEIAADTILNNLELFLTDPSNVEILGQIGTDIIDTIFKGAHTAIELADGVLDALFNVIQEYVSDPESAASLGQAGGQIAASIVGGITMTYYDMSSLLSGFITSINNVLLGGDWMGTGSAMVDGIIKGFKEQWEILWPDIYQSIDTAVSSAKALVDSIVELAKTAADAWANFGGYVGAEMEQTYGGMVSDYSEIFDDTPAPSRFAERYQQEKKEETNKQSQNPTSPIPEEEITRSGNVTVIQNIYSQKQTAADILDEAVIAQRRNQIMMLN